MNVNASQISGVLSQIRQLQAQQEQAAGEAGLKVGQGPDSGRFSAVLADAIQGVNANQQHAAKVSQEFANGTPGVELADVMLSLNQAQVSFKAMAEVRNRLVSSYQDIMNMPI